MPGDDPRTDAELLSAFRERGDETALDAFVRRHWEPSYRLARAVARDPATAEDATQEAFVDLVAAARGTAVLPGSLPTWLRAVVVNKARMQLRSNRRRVAREEISVGRNPREPGPLDPTEALRDYTEALPENLRLPIVLRFGLGYTNAEVGEALGCPTGTAASWIQRAIEDLRVRLGGSAAALGSIAFDALLAEACADARDPRAPAPPSAATLVARASSRRSHRRGVLRRALPGVALASVALLVATLAVLSLVELTSRSGAISVGSSGGASGTRPGDADSALPSPTLGTGEIANATTSTSARPGSTPSIESVAPASSSTVGLVIRGRVVDAGRKPVAGARITVGAAVDDDWYDRADEPLRKRLEEIHKAEVASVGDPALTPERRALLAVTAPGTHDNGVFLDGGETVSRDDGTFAVSCRCRVTIDGQERELRTHDNVLVFASSADAIGYETLGGVDHEPGPRDVGDVVLDAPKRHHTVVVRSLGAAVEGALVELGAKALELSRDRFENETRHERATLFELNEGWPGMARSDAAGLAELWHFGAPDLLRVEREGFCRVCLSWAELSREGLLEGDRILVELVREAIVKGCVRDASGKPIKGVYVRGAPYDPTKLAQGHLPSFRFLNQTSDDVSCETDALGCYVLKGLPAGKVLLTASGDEEQWGEASTAIVAPSSATDFVLRPPGTLVVKGTKPGAVEAISLEGVIERRDETDGRWWTFGKLEGRDEQVKLPIGTYRLFTHVAGCAPRVSSEITIRSGERTEVTVPLEPARAVSFRVLDASGKPFEGRVEITLADRRGDDDALVVAHHRDRDGSTSVDLSDAACEIVVGAPGFEEQLVHVPAGVGVLQDVLLVPLPEDRDGH